MPPKQDDLAARLDPSKQRARGFNTGKGAKGANALGDDNSMWNETPAQKQKRLQDEMMGVASSTHPSPGPQKPGRASQSTKSDDKTRERVVCPLPQSFSWLQNANAHSRKSLAVHRSWTSTSKLQAPKRRTIRASAHSIERRTWAAGCVLGTRRGRRC